MERGGEATDGRRGLLESSRVSWNITPFSTLEYFVVSFEFHTLPPHTDTHKKNKMTCLTSLVGLCEQALGQKAQGWLWGNAHHSGVSITAAHGHPWTKLLFGVIVWPSSAYVLQGPWPQVTHIKVVPHKPHAPHAGSAGGFRASRSSDRTPAMMRLQGLAFLSLPHSQEI